MFYLKKGNLNTSVRLNISVAIFTCACISAQYTYIVKHNCYQTLAKGSEDKFSHLSFCHFQLTNANILQCCSSYIISIR